MTSNRIETALRELKAEEAELKKRVESSRANLRKEQAELSYVQKAITSLAGKPANSSQSQKQTASKAEVVRDITAFLKSNGPSTEQDVKAYVEKQAADRGQSRTGLAMRFKNAITGDSFDRTGKRITLLRAVEESPQVANESATAPSPS